MGARFGQHFLKSEKLLSDIAGYGKISSNDVILEIGAATGSLTKHLVKAKKVYAIEIDKRLYPKLKDNMNKFKNVECINNDVLRYNFPKDINKIIGNLPYEISSPITEKILKFLNKQELDGKKALAILMFQKEFAMRMTAFPGIKEYSRLSVLVNYFSEPEMLRDVPKTAFRPAPKVESAIVKLKFFGVDENPKLFDLTRALFTHKNNNLVKALVSSRNMLKLKDKKKLKEILPELLKEFKEKKVFYLEIEELEEILEILKKKKII